MEEKPTVMIKKELFHGVLADGVEDFLEELVTAQREDPSLTIIFETMERGNLPETVAQAFRRYEVARGLLYFDGRLVIPDDDRIKKEVLEMYHDSPAAGHQGQA